MSVDHRMNTIIYYRIDYKVLLVLLVFMYMGPSMTYTCYTQGTAVFKSLKGLQTSTSISKS